MRPGPMHRGFLAASFGMGFISHGLIWKSPMSSPALPLLLSCGIHWAQYWNCGVWWVDERSSVTVTCSSRAESGNALLLWEVNQLSYILQTFCELLSALFRRLDSSSYLILDSFFTSLRIVSFASFRYVLNSMILNWCTYNYLIGNNCIAPKPLMQNHRTWILFALRLRW